MSPNIVHVLLDYNLFEINICYGFGDIKAINVCTKPAASCAVDHNLNTGPYAICIFIYLYLIIAYEPLFHPPMHIHYHHHHHYMNTQTQVPLEETLQKRLTYVFHSANYHIMVEVLIALKIAAEHLVKV